MTQFQSNPEALAESLKNRAPVRGVQPPPSSGQPAEGMSNTQKAMARMRQQMQPQQQPQQQQMQPQQQQMQPQQQQQMQPPAEDQGPSGWEMTKAVVAEPWDTWATAGGVATRSVVPKVIGALGDTLGTLFGTSLSKAAKGEVGGFAGLAAEYIGPLVGFTAYRDRQVAVDKWIEKNRKPEETDPMFFARVFAEDSAKHEALGNSFSAWITQRYAEMFGTPVEFSKSSKELSRSFVGYSEEKGRWLTMSAEEYARTVLSDTGSNDPGIQAGVFIGNALSSSVQSAVAILNPKYGSVVFGSFFMQGFSGAAQRYDDDKLAKGERPDDSERILHGLGGGVTELLFEMIGVGASRAVLKEMAKAKARRLSREVAEAVVKKDGLSLKRVLLSFAETKSIPAGLVKIAGANALEEIAVALSNNTREMLTYDPADTEAGETFLGRLTQGAGEAGLSGAIGGTAVGGAPMIAGTYNAEADIAAREQAARLRGALPPTTGEVSGEGFLPDSDGPAPAPERVNPAAESIEDVVATEAVDSLFDETAKEGEATTAKAKAARKRKAITRAREQAVMPTSTETPNTREGFLSKAYTDLLARKYMSFALAVLNRGQQNAGTTADGESVSSLPRKWMAMVYRGRSGKQLDSLSTEDRAAFTELLRQSINEAKANISISRESEANLEIELKKLKSKKRKTQEDKERLANIEAELGKRKRKAEKEARKLEEDEAENGVLEDEIEGDMDPSDDFEDGTEVAADPTAEVMEEPDAVEGEMVEEGAAEEDVVEEESSDELARRLSDAQATLDAATVNEDESTAEEARDEISEIEGEIKRRVTPTLETAREAADSILEKSEDATEGPEETDTPDDTVDEAVIGPEAKAPRVEEKVEAEESFGLSTLMKRFGQRLGIIAQGSGGKSLSEMSESELIAEASAQPGLKKSQYAQTRDKQTRLKFGKEATIDLIIEARMASVGLTVETMESAGKPGRESGDKVLQYALAPRREGDGGRLGKTVIKNRLSKAGLAASLDAAVEQGLGKASPKTPSASVPRAEPTTSRAWRARRWRERQRARIEAANRTLDPDSLGVLGDPVELPAEETAKERDKRIKAGRVKAEKRKPVEKMSKAELLDEIVDDYESVDESGPATNPQKRKSLKTKVIGLLRDEGVLWTRAEGKGQMVEIVNRIRRGDPAFDGNQLATPESDMTSGQLEAKKARRLQEGEVSQAQQARDEESARTQREATAAYNAKRAKETRDQEQREKDPNFAVAAVARLISSIEEKSKIAKVKFLQRLASFQRGDIVGRAGRGRANRKAGEKRYFGSRGIDLQAFSPRLWAFLQENLSGSGIAVDEVFSTNRRIDPDMTLDQIDERFGSNFMGLVRKLSGETAADPLSQEAMAIRDDLIALINSSIEGGEVQAEGSHTLSKLGRGELAGVYNAKTGEIEVVSVEEGTKTQTASETLIKGQAEGDIGNVDDLTMTTVVDAESISNDPDGDLSDEDYVAWSKGPESSGVVDVDDVSEIIESAGIWQDMRAAWRNLTGMLEWPGGSFSSFLDSRIGQAQLDRRGIQVTQKEADAEIADALKSKAAEDAGLNTGDIVAVPDSEANQVELDVIRRARARGRRVILYRANNARGVQFNGFVSRDSNTIYIRIGSLGARAFDGIKDKSAKKAIQREYERIMIQLVRHENFHLVERDPGMQSYVLLTDNYLSRLSSGEFSDAFDSEESAYDFAVQVLGMDEDSARVASSTKGGRAKIVSELRAEAASEIDALRLSGAESLLVNRSLIDQVMDRARRMMTRAGFRGESARHALNSINIELNMDVAQSAIRARESSGKGRGLSPVRFSADLDINGVPVFAFGADDSVLFSADTSSRAETILRGRQQFQDRNVRMRKAITGIEEDLGVKIPDEVNAIQLMDISPGLLARQGENFKAKEWRPIVKKMKAAKISPMVIGKYLHALHAKEANAYLLSKKKGSETDSGMTDVQADAIIAEMKSRSDIEIMDEIAKDVQAMTKKTLVMMKDAGLITLNEYNDIVAKYEFYVPLMDISRDRSFSEQDGREPVAGFTTIGNTMMYREGREVEGGNIIDNLADKPKELDQFFAGVLTGVPLQRSRIMRRIIRNNIRLKVLGMAQEFDQDGFTASLGPRDKEGKIDKSKLDEETDLVVRLDRDTVLFGKPFTKGEEVVISIKDTEIVKMLTTSGKSINPDDLPKPFRQIVQGLLGFTSWKRSMATRFNVDFIIPNPIRDIWEANATMASMGMDTSLAQLTSTAFLSIKTIGTHVVNTRLDKSVDSKDPQYQEYIDSGARQSSYRIQSAKDLTDEIYRDTAPDVERALPTRLVIGGANAMVVKPIRVVGAVLSDFTNTLDDAVRFAAWKMAKEQGMTTQQATAFSRDVTVDFSRHGDVKWVNQIFAFSNVGAQGAEKLVRKFKDRGWKGGLAAASPLIKTGLLQSLMCALLFDDDDYEEIRDDIKRGNFIIPTGIRNEDGSPFFLTIPLPYGLSTVHNAARLLGDSILRPSFGMEGPNATEMVSELTSSLSQINPFHSGDIFTKTEDTPSSERLASAGGYSVRRTNLLQTFFPDIADPIIEMSTGYDWAGRPIWKQSFDKSAVESMGSPRKSTSPVYSSLARGINLATGGNKAGTVEGTFDISPESFQFLVARTMFGPGNLFNRMSGGIWRYISGEEGALFSQPNDIPVVRRFLAAPNSRGTNTSRFYDFYNELRVAKKNLKVFEEGREAGKFKTMNEVYDFFGGEEYVKRQKYLVDLSKDKTVSKILTAQRKLNTAETEARAKGDWDLLKEIEDERNKQHNYIREIYEPES